MRSLMLSIWLAICLSVCGSATGTLTAACRAAESGELTDATFWEREPSAALVAEPAPVTGSVQTGTARNQVPNNGKPVRHLSADCRVYSTQIQPVGISRAQSVPTGNPCASCATFIALRHIIR